MHIYGFGLYCKGKMSCLLCLESTVGSSGHIDIYSNEAKAWKVQQVLQKYFKEELKAAKLGTSTRVLCQQCWGSVSTFHEFCLRVQRAHKAALNILQTSNEVDLKVETIKIENEVDKEVCIPTKRRRGRPRRTPAHTTNPEAAVALKCEPQTSVPDLTINEHIDDSPSKTKIAIDELQLGVEFEALQEQPMDLDCMTIVHELENATDILSPKNETNGTETHVESPQNEKQIAKKTEYSSCKKSKDGAVRAESQVKMKRRKQPKQRKELDEFIAEHFKLSCCLCKSPLENFTVLNTHFRKEHDCRGYVLCCGRKFYKRPWFADHLRVHQDPEYFKCPKCGKILANQYCLEMHVKNHESVNERIYQCDVCSKNFSQRQFFDRHMLTHVPQDQRNHACPQCDKTFPDKSTVTQHVKLVHLKLYEKICDICGKSVRGRAGLQRHMDEHAGIKSSHVKCEVCGTSFTASYGLSKHMKQMHSAKYQTPQTCSICQKESPTLHAHYRHIRYMHTLERKHACTICSKAFKCRTELKKHMARHRGGNVYTCTFCPRTFNSNAPMYFHRKKMHPREYEELCLQRQLELERKKRIV